MNKIASEINDILNSNPVADEIDAIIAMHEDAKFLENPVSYEIDSIVEHSYEDDEYDSEFSEDDDIDILRHYGVSIDDGAPGRGSGRFPQGSGDNPYQHQQDFVGRVARLRAKGLTDAEIAAQLGIKGASGKPSSNKLRAEYSTALNDIKYHQILKWQDLRSQGKTFEEIAQMTGAKNESTVRETLKQYEKNVDKYKLARTTAEYLKSMISENPKAVIDVGEESNRLIGVSPQKLEQALYLLEQEGYNIYSNYQVPNQTNPGVYTTFKVLAAPDVQYKDLYRAPDTGVPIDIRMIKDSKRVLKNNGEDIMPAFQYPESFDSKRLQVVYAEDHGKEKDGLVELRRGVDDISLGDAHYSQVRILVDGTHYIKGMAVYADDLPEGIDIRFNTNKTKNVPALGKKDNTVLKPISNDPNNPFNSLIKENGGQYYYIGEDGKKHLSVINKRADQGDWTDWSDTLPSQFLSKQPKALIKQQLGISLKDRQDQLNDILDITNPVIKEDRLLAFADACDNAAVTLKAAPFPNQKWHVILPIPSLSEKEVFAPQYQDGTTLALIRYPHGGTFEIPIVTVNNKNKVGRNMIGLDSIDGMGVNAKVAERLSGADFDGDTVMAIPITSKSRIKSSDPLIGLKDFDPKESYPGIKDENDNYITSVLPKERTGKEMGIISNLITDMTIKGASEDELARAVRHSMVVIDAAKHKLDYKKSEYDNRIEELKQKYQQNSENKKGYGGASTLISRAKSEVDVPKRKGAAKIDEEGNLYYNTAPDSERYYHKMAIQYQKDSRGRKIKDENKEPIPIMVTDSITGKEKPLRLPSEKVNEKTTKITRMESVKDARELSSGYEVEELYASYANAMKQLAREARKASQKVGKHEYRKEAEEAYKEEVESLLAQIAIADQNKPYERMAQNAANREIRAKIQMDDSLYKDKAALKKLKDSTLKRYREFYGAKRRPVEITDKQWEAIQSGAVRKETLKKILKYADDTVINKYAMPSNTNRGISDQKINRIKSLAASNYSIAQIAQATGLSPSTIDKYLHGKE